MRRVSEIFRTFRAPKEQGDPNMLADIEAVARQPLGRARARLVAAVSAIALSAMLLPATAAAIPGGAISGTVTNAKTKNGIGGAKVCATLEPSGSPACAEANANGEYNIVNLAEGNYEVKFTGEVCEGGACEPEYASAAKSAEKVETGKTTEHIDAALTGLRGRISGRVTAGGSPLSGAEVCIDFFDCVTAGANGEYTIRDLSPGSYQVSFRPKFECKAICERTANYITQYYNDQLTEEAADSVTVEAGQDTTGINAELHTGGEITGKVTTASLSPSPLANTEVCANSTATNKEGEREGEGDCTLTNSSGEYTLWTLATRSYEVEFSGRVCETSGKYKCTHPYVAQFYQGVVAVTAPNTTSGIDISLLEVTSSKPGSTTAPAVTGTASVGGVLSCSQGSWNNNPASVAYKWLRNGSAIAGQAGSTYTVQSADLGTGISCEVTATNAAGSTGALSNTLEIPKPAPGVAVVTAVHIKGATVAVTLRCTGASACTGAIKLVTSVLSGHGKHKHHRSIAIATTVGFTISVGAHATLRVRLTSHGLKLLAHAGKAGLGVQIGGVGVTVHKSVLKK
jgi:hypothetical protein